VVVLATPLAASAQQDSGDPKWAQPIPDPDKPGVAVGTNPAAAGQGGSGRGRCEFVKDPQSAQLAPLFGYHEPGAFFFFTCNGREGYQWFPSTSRADPLVLARQAARRLGVEQPLIGVNPRPDLAQLVNLRTWLWVEPGSWRPRRATAAVPGVSAAVTAVPVQVVWEMGDGGRVVCDGPGRPFDPTRPAAAQPPGCGYTYKRSSASEPGGRFVVTATLRWRVAWQASGAPGGGTLPPIATSTQVALRVAEVQALNGRAGS
jgi:hypothetical protein